MSIQFYTERGFPRELRAMGHYHRGMGDFMTDAAQMVKNASPWDLLSGIFVEKPKAEAAARIAEAQMQAQSLAQQQSARQETLRTVALVGAGLAGLLVLIVAFKPKPAKVAGYRKRRARR